MDIKDPCVLCAQSISKNANNDIWWKGNNAQPLFEGRCCDLCNPRVLAERIKKIIRTDTGTD